MMREIYFVRTMKKYRRHDIKCQPSQAAAMFATGWQIVFPYNRFLDENE